MQFISPEYFTFVKHGTDFKQMTLMQEGHRPISSPASVCVF